MGARMVMQDRDIWVQVVVMGWNKVGAKAVIEEVCWDKTRTGRMRQEKAATRWHDTIKLGKTRGQCEAIMPQGPYQERQNH